MLLSPTQPPSILREPMSQMQLVFDEEDEEGKDGERRTEGAGDPQTPAETIATSSRGPQEHTGKTAPQDPGWDAGEDQTLPDFCVCLVIF